MKRFKVLFILLLMISSFTFTQAQPHKNEPTFVLVHGAWHGGWGWQEVEKELAQKHYKVYAPSLTGLGDRKHLTNDDIDISTHIRDIVNLIEMEDLYDVYLVGHSYAGAVIAGVADQIPERLHKLIFLDAMIVENGMSPISMQPETVREIQMENIRNKEHFEPFDVALFGVTEPNLVKWVEERITP